MSPVNDPQLSRRSSITKIRLIGRQCEILYAGQTFTGVIWKETKHTWQIKRLTEIKTLPKEQSILRITYNDHTYEIAGKVMKGRHEDRIKTWMKRQW